MLGQLAEATRHASPLPSCRVQFVAEPTGQALFAATSHASVLLASQLRFLATADLSQSPSHGPDAPPPCRKLVTGAVPGTSCRGQKGSSLLTVSAPNSSQNGILLQNRRDRGAARRPRRQPPSRPVRRSHRGDVSPRQANARPRPESLRGGEKVTATLVVVPRAFAELGPSPLTIRLAMADGIPVIERSRRLALLRYALGMFQLPHIVVGTVPHHSHRPLCSSFPTP